MDEKRNVLTMFECDTCDPVVTPTVSDRRGLVSIAHATDRYKSSTRGMLMDTLQVRVHLPIPAHRRARKHAP